ncbi:PIN domain-like protein [Glonium stellatum]|uniref:PIN domain-like protein n=1 Tax=Glonium stellatum TaxID=574774 RepID=A0A8E2F5M2_9PEZI|nr:PIN domain-like protein [Glonium stellatum]
MGVTGLWTVLQPCARPIKIETLNKKRLAVDASIWIYQFLKAVRDKEGNALRNSHIVGFFRRICKLLFIGIKPVFVFDGGAPALKRQTINARKSRREGRREDAARTAGKLLALQMQRAAEQEEQRRRDSARHPTEVEEPLPENLVYVEEVHMTPQERAQNRKFRKKDAYHLPELDASLAEMGGPNDPRIMSLEELEQYARQFDTGEDINVYDFSKIDFDSPFFISLPASDRYNILNAARLRSRLRMGYSKDQLDTMFPDRMAFSKFQIERVRERNELTQRLMNINGMADDAMFGVNGISRVAGERGREYVLVKNDGVEGGWALGVVTSKDEGQRSKPIDVDKLHEPINENEDDEWEDDDEFEDIPIEGLNRLPKPKPVQTEKSGPQNALADELAKRRRAFYQSRGQGALGKPKSRKQKPANEDPDSLFLADEEDDDNVWENVDIPGHDDLFEDPKDNVPDEDDEELRRAIAMSLQQDEQDPEKPDSEDQDDYREVFQQQRVEESRPFVKGSGLAIARMANARSSKVAPKGPFAASDSEGDDIDLQAALLESRKSKRAPKAIQQTAKEMEKPAAETPQPTQKPAVSQAAKAHGFDGPLPFEKLDLGSSLLGKKKMQKLAEDSAGGFEKDTEDPKKKLGEPLPPWFAGDLKKDLSAQKEQEKQDREKDRIALEEEYQFQETPRLRKQDTHEVIDLDAPQGQSKEVVIIDSSGDEQGSDIEMEDVLAEGLETRAEDFANKTTAELPQSLLETKEDQAPQAPLPPKSSAADESEDELIDWSESDGEANIQRNGKIAVGEQATVGRRVSLLKSLSPEFEDVTIAHEDTTIPPEPPFALQADDDDVLAPIPADIPDSDSDMYSDPEDAALFASLTAEASEHARFASSLNPSSNTPVDFDTELRQLRTQQKKDRRDADEVTQTMVSECQQLLSLFGLPYITAPMEAEAQCAELVRLGLVDGIVTDDSDTFLFGGTRVYKNMFNAAKFVECYLLSDLSSEFSLTRDKLIAIAQLLGSDYTPGIPGIGPVTALEVLSEFATLDAFRDWWNRVQSGALPKDADKTSPWRRRFRRANAAKLFLPTTFPDPRVAAAYLAPDVDADPQPFVWGVPDLDALRGFLMQSIGWSRERTDEVLVPVIRDMNRREKEGTQSNITRFFEGSVGAGAFAPRVRDGGGGGGRGKPAGKRLGRALGRLREREGATEGGAEDEQAGTDRGGDGAGQEEENHGANGAENLDGKKKRKKGRGSRRAASTAASTSSEDQEEDDLYAEPPKKARKNTNRGRKK